MELYCRAEEEGGAVSWGSCEGRSQGGFPQGGGVRAPSPIISPASPPGGSDPALDVTLGVPGGLPGLTLGKPAGIPGTLRCPGGCPPPTHTHLILFTRSLSRPVVSGCFLFHLAPGTPTLPRRPLPHTHGAPPPACWMLGGAEGGMCPASQHPPSRPLAAARSTGLPGGRGKRSRLQPEPAAATWVGRGGTGAGKAGPGAGGGAGSWELGSGGCERDSGN